MPVFEVADLIVSRLGGPTVAALEDRFDPDGRCLTCGGRLGSGPVSVRAYEGRDTVTLVAYHAACTGSAWLDIGAEVLMSQETWAAATAAVPLPLGRLRPLHWLRGAPSRRQTLPVMFVRPALEMARVRQVLAGEAVNADVEKLRRLGFAELGELSVRVHPLRPVCQAWLRVSGHHTSVAAMATDQAWSAALTTPELADLIKDHGGIMLAAACDRDPYRLCTEPDYLDRALGIGEVLLGWAQLSPPPKPAAGH
jgi:hypothetical protein